MEVGESAVVFMGEINIETESGGNGETEIVKKQKTVKRGMGETGKLRI